MEAARRTHATAIAARTRIMSTASGAYKIWRHPHLKLVDKCLQYVVWLAMRLDKLDSVAKLAGPEGAKARRRKRAGEGASIVGEISSPLIQLE